MQTERNGMRMEWILIKNGTGVLKTEWPWNDNRTGRNDGVGIRVVSACLNENENKKLETKRETISTTE
jgi:hypothetical protein